MLPRRLFWKMFLPFFLVTLGALFVLMAYVSHSQMGFWSSRTAANLESMAHLSTSAFAEKINAQDWSGIDQLCKLYAEKSDTRFTIILPDGRVVGDSDETPAEMDNHGNRPEVREALKGETGQQTRFSQTIQENFMYVAVPLKENGRIIAVVRASVPITFLEQALDRIRRDITTAGLVVALAAALVSVLLSQYISRPLVMIQRGAERFAQGDLKHKLLVPDAEEMGTLAEAMNQMASQLSERIATIEQQRNEQEAILSSMVEGVVALDRSAHILSLNQAAAKLLGLDPARAVGHAIQEVVRYPEIQEFMGAMTDSEAPIERELVLPRNNVELYLRLEGTALRNKKQDHIGAVVVINDITQLHRLENIRREFVSNVSHELKTPVTSVKGFVETLLDSPLEDPEEIRHYLKIVATQADRLNSIIEDLLSLSRLQEDDGASGVEFVESALSEVLDRALEVCSLAADSRQVQLVRAWEQEVVAPINPALLEQAVINLLDNAIKYSEEGRAVTLKLEADTQEVRIIVADEGCGIAADHLPRLFERFYRVDKARSRKLGGTGLGLSIVKHIMQLHHGRATVSSVVDKGSVFTLHLPVSAQS